MERVQIAAGKYLIALPDGNAYNQGDTADLTYTQFREIRPELFPGTIIDLGPVPDLIGGTVVETVLITITSPNADFPVNAPSGTPVDGERLLMRIASGTTGYRPTWNSIYMSSGVATLPTTAMPANKTVTFGFEYNSTNGKWVLMAIDPIGY